MDDKEIIAFLLKTIKEQNITVYAIRRDTGVTESSTRKIMAGGGATIATLVKLANYLGYEIAFEKKK